MCTFHFGIILVFQIHASPFDLILFSFFNKISIVSKNDKQIQVLQSHFNSIMSIIQVYIYIYISIYIYIYIYVYIYIIIF